MGQAELEAMIDYVGNIGVALNRADPAKLEELYRSLRLEVVYHPEERAADVTIRPGRVVNVSEGDLRSDHTARDRSMSWLNGSFACK